MLPTIIVGGILAVIVIAVARKVIKDKKNGCSSCGGSCGCDKSCH